MRGLTCTKWACCNHDIVLMETKHYYPHLKHCCTNENLQLKCSTWWNWQNHQWSEKIMTQAERDWIASFQDLCTTPHNNVVMGTTACSMSKPLTNLDSKHSWTVVIWNTACAGNDKAESLMDGQITWAKCWAGLGHVHQSVFSQLKTPSCGSASVF